MSFYHFSANCGTKYVSVIDILNSSELDFKSCTKCGANNLVKWGNVIPVFECQSVTQKRQLPDLILYGGRMLQSFDNWSIVSDNVKKLYEREKLTGACFYPIELVFKARGKYNKIEKRYYIMSVTGRAEIDFEAMSINCSLCNLCGHFVFDGNLCPLFARKGVYPTIIKKDSWDGTDVFNHNDCTEKFVKKILEANLSGFEFICFEQKYDLFDNKKHFKTLNEFNKLKLQ